MLTWEIVLLDDVDEWFCRLAEVDSDTAEAVTGAIDLLEQVGPTLGRPAVDKVKGSRHHNMKELRPAGTSVRILIIFDPDRQAVLLVAGDKVGQWQAWYDRNIPIADERYEEWLDSQ